MPKGGGIYGVYLMAHLNVIKLPSHLLSPVKVDSSRAEGQPRQSQYRRLFPNKRGFMSMAICIA